MRRRRRSELGQERSLDLCRQIANNAAEEHLVIESVSKNRECWLPFGIEVSI